MALNGDILGIALDSFRQAFNDKTIYELMMVYGSLADIRLAYSKGEENIRINHIKNNMVLHVPGTGLTAGATAVTGTSTTGTAT